MHTALVCLCIGRERERGFGWSGGQCELETTPNIEPELETHSKSLEPHSKTRERMKRKQGGPLREGQYYYLVNKLGCWSLKDQIKLWKEYPIFGHENWENGWMKALPMKGWSFLASQDAQEVMLVSEWVSQLLIVSRLDWCDSGERGCRTQFFANVVF